MEIAKGPKREAIQRYIGKFHILKNKCVPGEEIWPNQTASKLTGIKIIDMRSFYNKIL